MEATQISDVMDAQSGSGKPYYEFLRHASMSLGLYVLPAGGEDTQQPHNEDEVYVVLSGEGHVFVGGEEQAVTEGSIIFVPKRVEHYFHSIEEELRLLVFFAPAES